MEIKKEDLAILIQSLIQDVDLLGRGFALKERIISDPDSLSNDEYKEIIIGFKPALKRTENCIKQYPDIGPGLGINVASKIGGYRITLDFFQARFSDFYKKHKDDVTQISKIKRHTAPHYTKSFDPNRTLIKKLNHSPVS